MTKKTLLVAVAVLALGVAPVYAGTIVSIGLYSTGVDNAGVVRTDGSGANDLHYSYGGLSVPALVIQSSAPSAAPYNWVDPSTGNSRWIAPQENVQNMVSMADVPYIYNTTFTLPVGTNIAGVRITGKWAVDNYGYMCLNTTATDGTCTTTHFTDILLTGYENNYNSYHTFTIDGSIAGQGLQVGLNTITINTINQHVGTVGVQETNPGGLRIEFDANFTAADVPEPGTLALLGGGLLALGLFRRRR